MTIASMANHSPGQIFLFFKRLLKESFGIHSLVGLFILSHMHDLYIINSLLQESNHGFAIDRKLNG